MPTTRESLAQAALALAAANDSALVDSQTMHDQAVRIAELEAMTPTPTPTPDPDPNPNPGPTPPPARNWPTRPTPPNVPTTGPTISTASKAITASIDLAGANYVQIDDGHRPVLFDIKADGVKVSRFRAYAKDGTAGGFDISRPSVVVEDAIWSDKSGWLFTVRAAGKGNTIRRQKAGRFARYFVFYENAQDITLEDVEVSDDGADHIPGTADDIGGADYESVIRAAGKCSGKMRRVRIVYGPTHPYVKACFRGEGVFDLEDIFSSGAINGINPLGAGDGGQGELQDRAGSTRFSNPDVVRRGVRAYAKANPNATPMDFARYVRSVARVWNDPTSPATQQAKGDKAWTATDAQLQGFLDSRAAQLGARSVSNWRRTENLFGYAIEAGSITTFEGTVIIKGDPRNGSCPFSGKVDEYPPGPKSKAGVETDPGWRFPFDTLRPSPVCNCTAAPDGTLCRFYGDAMFWTLSNDQARNYIKGKFYFNDVLFDWS